MTTNAYLKFSKVIRRLHEGPLGDYVDLCRTTAERGASLSAWGALYRFVIKNPSKQKHFFTAEGIAHSVFTRKVQVVSSVTKTFAEAKGSIAEIEVYPGDIAECWFVPVKTMNSSSFYCAIKATRRPV